MLERFGEATLACYRDILQHIQANGDTGLAEVRKRHPLVSQQLFSYLLTEAYLTRKAPDPEIPTATPPPQKCEDQNPKRAASRPKSDQARIQNTKELVQKLRDAEILRETALGPPGPDGSRTRINPKLFTKTIETRQKLVMAIVTTWHTDDG